MISLIECDKVSQNSRSRELCPFRTTAGAYTKKTIKVGVYALKSTLIKLVTFLQVAITDGRTFGGDKNEKELLFGNYCCGLNAG